MIRINDNFQKLPNSYLFSEIASKIRSFKDENPNKEVIRMDIGDITRPLFPGVIDALIKGVDDLSSEKSFKGYGPEQGYLFLREAIAKGDYWAHGILNIRPDDIFISDGAKSDIGNLGDILSKKAKVAIMNPAYPVYIDDNVIDGRSGYHLSDGSFEGIVYLKCNPENCFLPDLPDEEVDIIYLCFPNNPTGASISKLELKKWVDYALDKGCLIIYDSAYEAFVREEGMVRSIYEIARADEVAIEVRSFSKTAGFTGLRCGYTVVPEKLLGYNKNGERVSLNSLWKRRQTTKFNGASYLSQCGAYALYSEDGKKDIKVSTDYYLRNAGLIKEGLESIGFVAFGGINSPYVWATDNSGQTSLELFSKFLNKANVSTTPGSGFGNAGEGYLRFTGFNSLEKTKEAIKRLKDSL